MTICFLTRLFYPHIGGVERHIFELSKELVKKGHTVTIISEKTKGTPRKIKGVIQYQIPAGSDNRFKKFRIWRWILKNKKIILQSDIVHCHDVFYWYLPLRFLFPFKKVFTTFHGYESYPIRKKAIIVRKISELLSAKTICVGAFMKKWYGANPNKIIYGGVHVQASRIQCSPSALFVGRLDDQTGILEYVKAFEIISKKYKKFKFGVAGTGVMEKKLKNSRIKILGAVKEPERMFGSYHFAFVSRYLAILEAMAAKRLVFALYDNPLKKDYLEMSPFKKYIRIFNSSENLAKDVGYFLTHEKEEKEIAGKAYDLVKKMTWEKMTDTYLSLWSK